MDGGTNRAWGITGHPTIMIVDGKGNIVRTIDWIAMLAGSGEPEARTEAAWRLRLENELAAELDELLQ